MWPPESAILRLGRFTCRFCKETHLILVPEGRRAASPYTDCPKCDESWPWEYVVNEKDLPLRQALYTCKECNTINRIYFIQVGPFESWCSDCGDSNEVENKL